MKFIIGSVILAITFILFLPNTPQAQELGTRKGTIEAKKIIKHCWDISLEKRSTHNNSVMYQGHVETTACLENAIVEHASFLFDQPELSKENLLKKFRSIRLLLARFYTDLYNENNACMPSCGTMYYSFHNQAMSRFYEIILTDVIAQRNHYKY